MGHRPATLSPHPRLARRESKQELSGNSLGPNHQALGKEIVCFYCQQPGHKASVCPVRKAKVSGACYAPRPEVRSREATTLHRYKTVTINGQQVTALLDSGSFMSLVKRNLVPVGTVDYKRQENILCVHGDERLYPKADVTAVINEQSYLITVGGGRGLTSGGSAWLGLANSTGFAT